MQPSLHPYEAAPNWMRALMSLVETVRTSGPELRLTELVKTRASQINGSTYCIRVHTSDARAIGETADA